MGWRGPGDASCPKATPTWMKRVGAGMRVMVILASSLSEVSNQLVSSIKGIIVDVVDFLTPLLTVIAIGMIIFGILLLAARQEFYGLRLIIGGGVTLIIVYLVVPLLLGLIP
jgi:hypothetical protein